MRKAMSGPHITRASTTSSVVTRRRRCFPCSESTTCTILRSGMLLSPVRPCPALGLTDPVQFRSPLAGGFLTGKLMQSTKAENLVGTRFEEGNVMGKAFRRSEEHTSELQSHSFI